MAKICLISPHAKHDRVFLEADVMRGLGYDVTLILRTLDPGRPSVERYRGYDVRWIHHHDHGGAALMEGSRFAHHAERLAIALRPDVVHAHGLLALQAAMSIARTTEARIVYEAGANREALTSTLRRIEDRAMRSAALVLAPNDTVARSIHRRHPSRRVWVIDRRESTPERSIALARRIGAAPDDLLIAVPYTAPFSGPGLRALVDVLPTLPRQTRIAVLGHGAASGQIPPDVQRGDRVHLVWHDSWTSTVADAAGAHVGCVLDLTIEGDEPPADPALHCLKARLPMVTSNRRAFAEIVNGHGCGETVDPLDRHALKRTIEPYLFNPAVRRRAREAAANAARRMDASRTVESLVAAYVDGLGHANAPVPTTPLAAR